MLPLVAFLAASQAPLLVMTLPSPMAMPSDQLDESADILARKVARHEADAGPALMAALRACGLSVVKGKDRQVLFGPADGMGMGLALEEGEVLAVLNERPNATGLAFKSLSDAYSAINTSPKIVINQSIIQSFVDGANSPIKEVRFFSQFVDDLSMYGEGAWSFHDAGNGFESSFGGTSGSALLGKGVQNAGAMMWFTQQLQDAMAAMRTGSPPSPDAIKKLSVLQTAFAGVAQAGLQGGLAAAGVTRGPDGKVESRPLADKPLSMLQTILITRRIYADFYGYLAVQRTKHPTLYASTAPAPDPEAGRDNTGTILDGAATVMTTMMNEAVFKNAGETLESYAGMTANLNLAGAFTKLIETCHLVDMKLDPNPVELERRKDKQPGDPKKLTYTLSIKNPNGKMNTPGRMGSWFGGVDLSGPDDGPIQGSFVNWRLEQPIDILGSFVQYVSPGGAGSGTIQTTAKTDKDGKATIDIQTTPQKTPFPADAQSYTRLAKVTVEATLKGSNLQQDIVDALGVVTAVATGDAGTGLSGGFKAAAADMLSRTSLLSTRSFPVKVTDWKEPLWEGTFTLTLKGVKAQGNLVQGGKWIVDRTVKGRIVSKFEGIPQAIVFAKFGGGPYDLVMDRLGDADIHDSAALTGLGGGGCMGKEYSWKVDEGDEGPVALLQAPYGLTGGFLTVSFVHEGGKDVRKISCLGEFTLPVRAHRVKSGQEDKHETRPPTSWIEYASIPTSFNADASGTTPSTSFSGSSEKTIPITIDNMAGELHWTIAWEMHAKKTP